MSDNAKEDPVNLAESTSTSPVNSTVNPVQIPPATQLPDPTPPPPYFEPLPQLNPNFAPTSAIYLTSLNMPPPVGSSPTRLRCPNCSADIVTQINFKSGCMTWAICGSICAIGLFAPCAWLGCQFIPFCIDSCKDVQHNCPNCRAYIGTFDRMK